MVFNAVGFRLPARNATRWNSSFYMLAAFLKAIEQDPSLQTRLSAVKKHRPLNANQILILKEIVLILKPFESVTFKLILRLLEMLFPHIWLFSTC